MHIGRKIKLARVTKGYTQQELAEKINKTRPLISHIEQTGKANYYTLQIICEVLDLSTEDLESDKTMQESPVDTKVGEVALLRSENKLLRQEIQTLKELVASQRSLIQILQERKD